MAAEVKLQLTNAHLHFSGVQVSGASFDTSTQKWQLTGSSVGGRRPAPGSSPAPPPGPVPLGDFDALVMTDVSCARKGEDGPPGHIDARPCHDYIRGEGVGMAARTADVSTLLRVCARQRS